MEREFKIRELCGDWALDIPLGYGTVVLYFNSLNNARLVKAVLEHEDAHPNEAVPYKPALTLLNIPLTLEQLRKMDGEPVWIVEYPDWGALGVIRRCRGLFAGA